jgi:NAD(P)-dependent dehydrogenase (short-subunit alcohol dehydrogenase family)
MTIAADLKGKVALVTGASSGLGRHFADVLADAGAHVVLAARRLDALDKAASTIRSRGGVASALALDITDQASIDKAVAAADAPPIDILVNCAGITVAKPALAHGEQEWDAVLATNLTGAFRLSQAVARTMKDRGAGGAIVNVASILGLRVAGNVAAYATSKAALIQLTKALALEWARYGIRVNALCPGYVETDLNRDFFATPPGQALIARIPQRRLGQPGDLDGPLLLLCGNAGRYMTGTALVVDGGHLVSSL